MTINGLRWRVRLVSPSNPYLLTPWNTYALGACDKLTQTIYINRTLPLIKVKEVLYHEITHAVIFSYRINVSPEEEENVVEIVTNHGIEIEKLTRNMYKKIKGRL